MADVKISGLPNATTPVAGTEVLPIVQGGQTRQVSINNLTTGKSVSATQFNSTIATGTAPLTVASTTEVANLRAANATSADTANQVKSNATTGVLQIAGPAAAATRVMTTPDANFTVARTDVGQTFTGNQQVQTATSTTNITLVADLDGGNNYSANYALRRSGVAGGSRIISNRNTATGGVGLKVQVTANNAGEVAGTYVDAVAVDNLGNTTLSTGNLVIGTSGKGIDFSVTPDGSGTMTSELLADYEEGTFTATLAGFSSNPTTPVTTTSRYTKIGRQVNCQISFLNVNTTGASGAILINGLPFTSAVETTGVSHHAGITNSTTTVANLPANQTQIQIFGGNVYVNSVYTPGSGQYLLVNITYIV